MLARASKASWGYSESWLERWKNDLTIEVAQIERDDVFVDESGGALLGFYVLRVRDGTATLEHLWIAPGAMRRGLGRTLVNHARAFARRHGASEIQVESDPNAAGFYERMGGERIGAIGASIDGVARELPRYAIPVDHPASQEISA